MYSTHLTNPLAVHSLEGLYATVNALQATIIATWPRLRGSGYTAMIIEMIAICWSSVQELTNEANDCGELAHAIQRQLRQTWKIVAAVELVSTKDDDCLAQCTISLAGIEPQLQPLFR